MQRLERLSLNVAAHAAGDAMSEAEELVQLVNGGSLRRDYAQLEDPAEERLCEELAAPGGSYLVGSGVSGYSAFWLRILVGALYGAPWEAEESFLERVTQTVMTALSVSDIALRRASLSRASVALGEPGADASVPPNLGTLKSAIAFDLHAPEHEGLDEVLAPLVVDRKPALGKGADHTFAATPFAVEDGELIVALPFEVASSIRHFVVKAALEEGCAEGLHLRYLLTAHEQAMSALLRMGWQPLRRDDAALPWPDAELPMVESVYRLDRDKLCHLLLLGDDFVDYDTSRVFQSWDVGAHKDAIAARIELVRVFLEARADTERAFTLLVVAPLDRGITLAFEDAADGVLVVSLFDLEVFARLDDDPLALWKLAQAFKAARHKTEILMFSVLDLYALYRELGHTLDLLDEPEGFAILPGAGGELRQDMHLRADVHPVPHPLGVVVEVERWLPHAPTVPIYLPRLNRGGEVCVVEIAGAWIWISASPLDLGANLSFTIAYWLWQIAADIPDAVRASADDNGVVDVRVELSEPEWWSTHVFGTDDRLPDGGTDPSYELDVGEGGSLVLRVLEGARVALHSSDNTGERELVRALLELLCAPEAERDELVERHVPTGYKKHMLAIRGPDPRLDDRNLLRHRPVFEYDQHQANALVSELVIERLGLGAGVAESQKAVLDAYVRAAFDSLEQLVASLSPIGLIERLIGAVDRCTHEQSYRQASALTRTLTYGGADEAMRDLDADANRQNRAAVCTRFLVEYVAASPPAGTAALTDAVFDQMLALAAEIVDGGLMSDAVHYGVATADVYISPSKRVLFHSSPEYYRAQATFAGQRVADEVEHGHVVLESLVWKPPAEALALPDGLDEAFRAEFGITAAGVGEFLNSAIEYAISSDGAVVVVPRARLVSDFGHELGWSAPAIERALEGFSLGPRPAFLKPDAPHEDADVYPWRFNRSLSFIRRPFVFRGSDVVFGVRHVFAAQMHLAQLIDDRRFRASTPAMKRYLGRAGKQIGEAFEDAVGGVLDEAGFKTRLRVNQLDGLRLARIDGAAIGDIDVLALDSMGSVVYVVDAKCLTPALTPSEVALEISQLFGEGGKRSALKALQERTAWVEAHLAQVLRALGEDHEREWTVVPMFVFDRDLISNHAITTTVRVETYHSLKRALQADEAIDKAQTGAGGN